MFKKILIANDGSEGAFKALDAALRLAHSQKAQAHMICVEETQWIPGSREEVIGDKEIADLPDDRSELTEEPVLQLIRDAINCAFKECEPESLIMLQLLHTGGLHPEEIAPMFGCVATTVTRSARATSRPSMPGSPRSRTIKSGRRVRAAARASPPVAAVITSKPACRR